MVAFPTNIRYLDAASFSEEFEDVSIKPAEMEGGYVISRPHFTRPPRRTFSWKYTGMLDADKLALQNFWKLVKGRSNAFTWTHPTTGEVITCRFGEMTMKFSRIGFGPTNVWESDTIVIVEV